MEKINSDLFTKALISGVENLHNHLKLINKLNVFPVPDGDTGSNMSMTADSGFEYIHGKAYETVSEVSREFARGMLMGARGNSGVILSQIFKGVSIALENKEKIVPDDLKEAFKEASEKAYKSVGKPVEGTILTVIREIHEAVEKESFSSIPALMDFVVFEGNKSLDNTPNLLPQLKEAGVVDSGGAGLMMMLEGIRDAIHGKPVVRKGKTTINPIKAPIPQNVNLAKNYGYCTEFMISIKEPKEFSEEKFNEDFEKLGDSIVVVKDEDILKLHIHTKKPYKAMEYVHQYGEFIKIKMENMSLQAEENHQIIDGSEEQVSRKLKNDISIISVAPTKELAHLMKEEYGVSYTIHAKNPSTKEFLHAIETVDAKRVIIVPNNGDAILSAKQAKKVEQHSKLSIIPTKNIMQGLITFISYDPESDFKDNLKNMRKVAKDSETAMISTAAKNVTMGGVKVKEGETIGIIGKEIIVSDKDELKVLQTTAKKLIKNKEILTIIIGEGHNIDVVNEFKTFAEEKYNVEVDIIVGNQPVYKYILGAE